MRLSESKLFDDLQVIMTIQERRTQMRTEREIKGCGKWCGREMRMVRHLAEWCKADTEMSLSWTILFDTNG